MICGCMAKEIDVETYHMETMFVYIDTLGDRHEMIIDIEFEDDDWINSLYVVLFKLCFAFGVGFYPALATEVTA